MSTRASSLVVAHSTRSADKRSTKASEMGCSRSVNRSLYMSTVRLVTFRFFLVGLGVLLIAICLSISHFYDGSGVGVVFFGCGDGMDLGVVAVYGSVAGVEVEFD